MLRISFLTLGVAAVALSAVGATYTVATPQAQPFLQTTERTSLRAAFFGSQGLVGEYCFNFNRPTWKSAYKSSFDKMTKGKRIRFGKDFWSNLDTFCSLEMGGEKVEPGYYYLALERSKQGDWSLVLLDHEKLRKSKTDAMATSSTRGGIKIPLQHEKVRKSEDALNMLLEPDTEDDKQQNLVIRWGPHKLTTGIRADL